MEKGIGWGLGAAADLATMGGLGGGVVSGLKFVGADLAVNAVIDTVDAHQRKEMDVPKVIAPGHEQEWIDANSPQKEEKEEAPAAVQSAQERSEGMEKREKEAEAASRTEVRKEESAPVQETAPEPRNEQQVAMPKSNTGGWQGILTGLGLNGLGDIGRNAGYILAMLPDILLGMFTGKTQSLGIRDNLVPIASIMAGLFVKNPLLKMTLIGLGGANLLNKAGHEQLAKQEGMQQPLPNVRYRRGRAIGSAHRGRTGEREQPHRDPRRHSRHDRPPGEGGGRLQPGSAAAGQARQRCSRAVRPPAADRRCPGALRTGITYRNKRYHATMKDNHNTTTIWQTRINQNSMRLSARRNFWPRPSSVPARKAGPAQPDGQGGPEALSPRIGCLGLQRPHPRAPQ